MNAEQYGGTGEQGCFEGDTQHSLAFAWWVPVDHGNEIQSDSATFDLQLYTEQCRHNDGERIDCRLDACTRAFLLDEPTDLALMDGLQWDGETVVATETVDVGTGIGYEPLGVAPFGFDPVVACVDVGTTVTWEWVDQNEVNPNIPETVHHNVILFESPGDDCDLTAVDPASFAISPLVGYNPPAAQEPEPFTHTFDEPGIYPYYCEPHGAPPAIADPDPGTAENEGLDDYHHPPGRPELDEPQNLFGMRGAVIVTEPRE
jgi:plastocyanin